MLKGFLLGVSALSWTGLCILQLINLGSEPVYGSELASLFLLGANALSWTVILILLWREHHAGFRPRKADSEDLK